jgi:hypothetical protein
MRAGAGGQQLTEQSTAFLSAYVASKVLSSCLENEIFINDLDNQESVAGYFGIYFCLYINCCVINYTCIQSH